MDRNGALARFGQPTRTWGGPNEPRLREEHGYRFSERWEYVRPLDLGDPWTHRVLYWHQYGLVGVVRRTDDGAFETEETP